MLFKEKQITEIKEIKQISSPNTSTDNKQKLIQIPKKEKVISTTPKVTTSKIESNKKTITPKEKNITELASPSNFKPKDNKFDKKIDQNQ